MGGRNGKSIRDGKIKPAKSLPISTMKIDTTQYAGKMAVGTKDSLYGITREGDVLVSKQANVLRDSKSAYGKQQDVTLVTTAHSALELDLKGRPTWHGVKPETLFNGIKTVTGNTYPIKDILKQNGFRFDGKTKNWIKD